MAYAWEMAGTDLDLDPDLESAGIEHLGADSHCSVVRLTLQNRTHGAGPRRRRRLASGRGRSACSVSFRFPVSGSGELVGVVRFITAM